MQLTILKQALKTKNLEFEIAMQLKRPHEELLKIYKEIKALQYEIIEAELSQSAEKQLN